VTIFIESLDTLGSEMEKIISIARNCYKHQFHTKTDTFIQLALEIGALGDIDALAEANHLAGNFHQYNLDTDQAKIFYQKAIDLSTSEFNIAKYLVPLGGLYKLKGAIPQAIEISLDVKNKLENLDGELDDKDEKVRKNLYGAVLNSLDNIYNSINDFENANMY